MSEISITKANYKVEVADSKFPCLLDFGAEWCGPCKMTAPFIKQISDEYEGKLKVGTVNIDDEPELAVLFHITSVPAFFLVKNGEIVSSTTGYHSKEDLIKILKIDLATE